MTEWWSVWSTYRPSDFLLFSPKTYYRLFELYNADIWPLQIVALASAVAILALACSPIAARRRTAAALLAACWLWIAWAFHWQRYATINWAAAYFAVGFAIQALLLLWAGTVRDNLRLDIASGRARIAIAIFGFALVVQPLLGLLLDRGFYQLEVFGVAPDPTAVATLGLLLAARRMRWIALPIPLLWCLVSGTTLYVMDANDALVLPMVGLLTLTLILQGKRPRPHG